MQLLNRFEQTIERLIEGPAFRIFRSDLQPVEIAKRLQRELESHREEGPAGQTAPTRYDVWLSPEDYGRFVDRRVAIEWELADYLIQAARRRGIRLNRRPTVQLAPDQRLGRHDIAIDVRHVAQASDDLNLSVNGGTQRIRLDPVRAPDVPAIWLRDPGTGDAIAIDRLPFAIGRSVENDLIIPDKRVSRQHALIKEVDGRICVADLESTNQTFVNGHPVKQAVLASGDSLSIGGYPLVVEIGALPVR